MYRDDIPDRSVDLESHDHIKQAIAALEVRSSSFLVGKCTSFMDERQKNAIRKCGEIRKTILDGNLGELLKRKNM